MTISEIRTLYTHRQSCRAFDGREVPADLVKRICAAALLAAGLWLARAGGNITLLLVALWLLVNFFSDKKRQFGACHAGWKRVQ